MIQREIKFRAWDDKNKEWLLGYEMPNLGGFSLFGELMLLGEWSSVLDGFVFRRGTFNNPEPADLKVMQFTGLKDKNGKEIYEGDRLATESQTFEVRFDARAAAFRFVDVVGNSESPLNYDDIEVIGNIYESPELLTQEKVEIKPKQQ